MKLFRLKGKTDKDNSYLKDSGMSYEEQEKLISGELVSISNFGEYEISAKSKKKPDVYSIGHTEFYVNEKVKNIILNNCQSDENIKFLNIEIEGENYYLLNILNNIECFDWDKSEYTTYSNKNFLKEVNKLVIKPEKLNGRKIFRIKEYKFEVFVIESIKTEIKKIGVSGIDFLESMDLTFG